MRKPIKKETRKAVYDKFGGRCAYCGKEIKYDDMQVDHFIPLAKSIYGIKEEAERVRQMFADGTIDGIDNLMPSCRACNFYKGCGNIEQFRTKIKTQLSHTCIDSFQSRLAMQYGMIEYHPWDGRFYFEKHNENETTRFIK